MMQRYIGSDVSSMVTLPVIIFEPTTMLKKMAGGRFLPTAATGRVLASSFHSILHVGSEMLEQAFGNISVPDVEPEMTWKIVELSVMLEQVQAHVAPTDVDPRAGLQWLPKILRSSPKVKRTGALLERVFMPCQMYFCYTRHKGGTPELKVAGVPGVTEELFNARQSALDREQSMLNAAPMSYTCALCDKEYRSEKAHAQHLNSRSHALKASKESGSQATAGITIIKPRKHTPSKSSSFGMSQYDEEESGDEWVEVDPDDDMDESDLSDADGMDVEEELDTTTCFVCDLKHDNIENCMTHMHKHHGFYIPDVEYLKDPNGLLTYVGLKVKRDFMCLYCNRLPFRSLEAVRKHMIAKGHCKIRYGDGCDDEEAEFEEFYDYSSSFMDGDEKQLVAANGMTTSVELRCGGSEIIIRQNDESKSTVKRFGSREFLRYYRQKPRPSPSNGIALAVSLASRYRSMGLATVQSKEQMVKMKVVKEMNRLSVDSMRAEIGMKSNVIKNLPRNVPH